MPFLLTLSAWIDTLNTKVGKLTTWMILITTLISAGNAIVRKLFDTSSNALLEVQWYIFAGVFLLGSAYGLLQNSHVRIDFISARLSPRTRNWIDVVGIVVALIPFCLLSIYLSWPLFVQAYESGEMSQNAGGLIRWPAYALIPAGFSLLALQGVSELIKRLAFLTGQGSDSLAETDEEADTAEIELMAHGD